MVSPQLEGLPLPIPDSDTLPFWEGAERGLLLGQRCAECSTWAWQPRPMCSVCHSLELRWRELAGTGRVMTWTVPRPPLLAPLAALVPFVIVVVELTEGIRMIGMLADQDGLPLRTDGTDVGLAPGAAVRVVFRQQDGFSQPGWALV